jgi:hypothetical protein
MVEGRHTLVVHAPHRQRAKLRPSTKNSTPLVVWNPVQKNKRGEMLMSDYQIEVHEPAATH